MNKLYKNVEPENGKILRIFNSEAENCLGVYKKMNNMETSLNF